MSTNPPGPALPVVPSLDEVARAWHALSDHGREGVPLDDPDCDCRVHARSSKPVVDLFTGVPLPEPDGLGAVVVNPLTNQVWVRAAHPAVPLQVEGVGPDEWYDPTSEDWFTWEALPRPLVMQSPGWTPPPEPQHVPQSDPTGLGAVATDRHGKTWVRIDAGGDPWLNPDSLAAGEGVEHTWENLAHPVTIHSHGWVPPATTHQPPDVPEPTGIGAVILDATRETWVRVHDCALRWPSPTPTTPGWRRSPTGRG